MSLSKTLVLLCCLFLGLAATAAPPQKTQSSVAPAAAMVIDNSTYIDANKILMFVTNHGNFGRDISDLFGNDYGTYYPYIDTSYITAGILSEHSPMYSVGLWFGGKVNGETRVAVSEYGSEYTSGPMSGGTFLPDDPAFKVYKLYADSLLTNPNDDYTNWPVSQGAPLDDQGHPLCRGDQTLWTVFNDADPDLHTIDPGETLPLGLEVRQMIWAADEEGTDIIPSTDDLKVTQCGSTQASASVTVVDPLLLTGHDYWVVIDTSLTLGPVWHLIDQTLGAPVLYDQTSADPVTIDGFEVTVTIFTSLFEGFEVVANAAGVIDPPEAGAAEWYNFPVPLDGDGFPLRPTDAQQATGDGLWLFHTADNGGSSGGGTLGSFNDFLERSIRNDNVLRIGQYDYEMRFTGDNGGPSIDGGYAIEAFNDNNVFWVPFELWRTGLGTPDDPSDDIRLIPFILDNWGDSKEGNDQYGLESWGSALDATGSGDYEHSVSGGDNDPFTDWVYWYEPEDMSFGEAGYDAVMTEWVTNGDISAGFDLVGDEIMARTVLVNWNGGIEPPFNQDCPEQGTVFRILTAKEQPYDTFTFTATPPPTITTGDEGVCVYVEYWVHNKGGNAIEDCYMSLWSDPDLGAPGDDLVGCDTLNDIFFCYNATNDDGQYGTPPPAVGFKYLVGPIVPCPGETADLHGVAWPDHKDIGMTAFAMYVNGTDPDNFNETYGTMQGLTKTGEPYEYDGDILTYFFSGDPVAGTGDLDFAPDDRRMMGSSGPFDLSPGDSMYVLLRMAARHGVDNLDAITELKRILNLPLEDEPVKPEEKPKGLTVRQNCPNPFNPSTTIEYTLSKRARVTVDVFNILGQNVKRLVAETQPAGVHTTVWNGTNQSGEAVSTGFYFYRVKAGDMVNSKKMLLLK